MKESPESGQKKSAENPEDYFLKLLKKNFSEFRNVRLEFYPKDGWELVTLYFNDASVTLSREVKKLSLESMLQLMQGLKEYRDAVRQGTKANPLGMGGAGSVYMLHHDFLIKESNDVSAENDALKNSYDLQQVINNAIQFPTDIRLVHSLALIEPRFSRRTKHGRKKYASQAFTYDTVYGSQDDKRISKVEAYVIMPFLSNSIQLEDFLSSKKEKTRMEIAKKLLNDGAIKSMDEEMVKNYIKDQTRRIQDAFYAAQQNIPAHERPELLDTSPRNIFVRLEHNDKTGRDEIIYYKIDH